MKPLTRDTLLNLAGQILPLGVAVAAVPALVAGLGAERFGILALAWAVLGSFSVFDIALGRAVTRLGAAALERGEPERLPGIAGGAAALQAALGLSGTVLVAAAAPLVVERVLGLTGPLAAEARSSFLLLALSFPLTLVAGIARSLLEALRRFDSVNLVRAPAGAATFALPWLGVTLGWSLPEIVGLLVLSRAAVLAAYALLCRRAVPPRARGLRLDRGQLGELVRFGGWVTVSNAVPPLLVLLERFLLGALASLTAVAHFSVPHEMVFRLWVIPTSLVAAMFPVLARASERGDAAGVRDLARRAARAVLLLLAGPALLAVLGAGPLLEIWMGPDFARAGAPVLRLLALGMLASALGSVPAAVLQARGRPDLTARLRLAELPVFALAMAGAIVQWGAVGAAWTSALRGALDAALLFGLAGRLPGTSAKLADLHARRGHGGLAPEGTPSHAQEIQDS